MKTISLQIIIQYIPNLITASRLILLFIAITLFNNYVTSAALLLLFTVILDYADGIVARRLKQCSFFGFILDWYSDLLGYALMLFWWNQVEPNLILVQFTLLSLELAVLVVDIVSKTTGWTPTISADHWSTWMLKHTMEVGKKGYSCRHLGYWNLIFLFVCILARILFIRTLFGFY